LAGRAQRSGKTREALAGYVLLAPDVVGLTVVYVLPMLFTVYLSFHAWTGMDELRFVAWRNYLELFEDPVWLRSVRITLSYLVLYVPAIVAGSLCLALLVNTRLREVKLYRTIFFLPIVMPVIIAAVVWTFIYEPSYGVINFVLSSFGFEKHAWLGSQKEALFAVVVVSVWKQTGYFMIIFLAGLKNIPAQYYEAGDIDGAGPVVKFFRITLPLLKPTFVFVLVINLITALQDFDQIYVMTKGGPNYATHVQIFYIYEKAFRFWKMGAASAASIMLFMVIFLLSLLQLKIFRGGSYD
jgi:multiple sugar transport system permease protein